MPSSCLSPERCDVLFDGREGFTIIDESELHPDALTLSGLLARCDLVPENEELHRYVKILHEVAVDFNDSGEVLGWVDELIARGELNEELACDLDASEPTNAELERIARKVVGEQRRYVLRKCGTVAPTRSMNAAS